MPIEGAAPERVANAGAKEMPIRVVLIMRLKKYLAWFARG
jgi:hypothetical protein